MTSADQKLERARYRLSQRQLRPAVKILKGILRDDPKHIDTLDLLSQLALKNSQFDYARQLLETAVTIWPRSARLHMNLGVAFHGMAEYDEAVRRFHQALECNNQIGMIYYHLGLSLFSLGRLNDAGHCFQHANLRMPSFVPAYEQLAATMLAAGTHLATINVYKKILELQPERDDVLVDLGNALIKGKRQEEAVKCFQRALEINNKSIPALNNLANTLRSQGKTDEAVEILDRAIAIQPANSVLHNSRGLALETGDPAAGIAAYNEAIRLRPNYRKAHYNLGGIQQELGDLAAAEAHYKNALRIEPNNAETQFRAGLLKLLQGDFQSGWSGYQRRWEMEETAHKKPDLSQPEWQGEDLSSQSILVYSEQGLGDTLQFVRYMSLLKQRGATTMLRCQPRLKSLLSRCKDIDHLSTTADEPPEQFDFQAPLLSLPSLLGTMVDNVPADCPYLYADPEKVEQWKERLAGLSGLRVGISWQGSPTYLRDNWRSIPLECFPPLTEISGVHLVSLQQGVGQKQLSQLAGSQAIVDLSEELDQGPDGFEDTAAVIENLDLVITSDTAIAHLAGGLGAKTWVALQYVPEWRWQLETHDCLWYPSATLYRQSSFNDWTSVFAHIAKDLSHLANNR